MFSQAEDETCITFHEGAGATYLQTSQKGKVDITLN